MLNEEDLDLIEQVSPFLRDFLVSAVNEGVDSMLEIMVKDEVKESYDDFFNGVSNDEAQQMYSFLKNVALPFYTKREMYEYSAKCKKMVDLLTKYKNLKKD